MILSRTCLLIPPFEFTIDIVHRSKYIASVSHIANNESQPIILTLIPHVELLLLIPAVNYYFLEVESL